MCPQITQIDADFGRGPGPGETNTPGAMAKREICEEGPERPDKRASYLLRYRPDLPTVVFESKPTYASAGDEIQQANKKRLKELRSLPPPNSTPCSPPSSTRLSRENCDEQTGAS